MNTLMEYECPCCGGKVEFDSATQKMKCPYCETTFDVEALREHDRELESESQTTPENLDWQMEKQRWLDEEKAGMKVYQCRSCGGEIITDETTAASHCPYCGSPVIMTGNLADDLKPDGVIPFKVDKAMAMNALKTHMSGKKLLAKRFASDNVLEEVKGVYVPFWLFDGTAEGEARYHATRVRSWNTPDHICTETSHFDLIRSGSMTFRGIPVDGAEKVPDELMESVEPFDFSGVEPFRTAYLSGFFADRYDVESEQSQTRAAQRAKKTILDALARTAEGYDSVQPERSSIRLTDAKAKYVLCPMWLLTVRYEGENYLFAVNGQTGRIAGNMPVDEKGAAARRVGYGFGIGAVLALLSVLMFGVDLIAIAGCFFIGWMIGSGLVGQMEKEVQNVEAKDNAALYADPGSLSLHTRQDRFLYANVTRTPIPQNRNHPGSANRMGGVGGMNGMGRMNGMGGMGSPRPGSGTMNRPGSMNRPPMGGVRPGGGMNRPGNRPGGMNRPSGGMGRPSGPRPGGGSRPGPRSGPKPGGGRPRGGGPGRR